MSSIDDTVPTIGYIYEPVDQVGVQVRVVACLQDYYYFLNCPPAVLPDVTLYPSDILYPSGGTATLAWDYSDIQNDQTNDAYRPWKTK